MRAIRAILIRLFSQVIGNCETMRNQSNSQRSDLVLEKRIRSLGLTDTPYYVTLLGYFCEHAKAIELPSEKEYESASRMISTLWKGSDKDPAVFEFADLLEPILRQMSKNRDHRIHSSKVFMLGYYIINAITKINPHFDFKANKPNLAWMLSATFHDIGYAIQETEFWLNRMFEQFLGVNPKFAVSIGQIMPMIYLDFMRILSAYHLNPSAVLSQNLLSSEIDWIFYNELNSKLIEKNHGVISALMLAHLLGIRQGFLEERGNWDFKYNHLPACHAIAAHWLPSISIRFATHPLAFLLVLCDEIQDWGRYTSSEECEENDIVYLRDVEVLNTNPISIKMCVKASRERQKELRNKLLERLHPNEALSVSITNVSGNPIVKIKKQT